MNTETDSSRPRHRSRRRVARSELQRARERRGLTIEDCAAQCKIQPVYLVALERGDTTTLKPGSFRQTYHRQYRSFLGLPPMAEDLAKRPAAPPREEPVEITSTTGTMPRGDELPTTRLVASGFAFTLLVVLLLRVGALLAESPPAFFAEDATAAAPEAAAGAAAPTSAQTVGLRAIEDVRVSVTTDEGTIRRGILPGGEAVTIESDGPITVEISDLTRVTVRYNESRLEPLHNLSKGRRLVFLPGEPAG